MDVIGAIIVLIILLAANYFFVTGSLTSGLENKKLRSLIITITNFIIVILFIICLPGVGGYTYESFQDMIHVLFSEETAATLTITILGFFAAMAYFAFGAYHVQQTNKIKQKIMQYEKELQQLEEKLSNRRAIINLVMLVKNCGGDTQDIENYSDMVDIKKITDAIKETEDIIQQLSFKI